MKIRVQIDLKWSHMLTPIQINTSLSRYKREALEWVAGLGCGEWFMVSDNGRYITDVNEILEYRYPIDDDVLVGYIREGDLHDCRGVIALVKRRFPDTTSTLEE